MSTNPHLKVRPGHIFPLAPTLASLGKEYRNAGIYGAAAGYIFSLGNQKAHTTPDPHPRCKHVDTVLKMMKIQLCYSINVLTGSYASK